MQDRITITIESANGKTRTSVRIDHGQAEILTEQLENIADNFGAIAGKVRTIIGGIDSADAANLDAFERADVAEPVPAALDRQGV
jgi:hypothetical protein